MPSASSSSTSSTNILPEKLVQDSFHSYLRSSLSQAKAERLLDEDLLSSAEADLMITGPALCLFFAALRSTTNPPSVPLPRSKSATSHVPGKHTAHLPDQPTELSYENCPPAFESFLRVWAKNVPLIQGLAPEYQHDIARVVCNLPPIAQPINPSINGIAADLRGVAIEISQRRSFQDRYNDALQAALDSGNGPSSPTRPGAPGSASPGGGAGGGGGLTPKRASFVPPPMYQPSPPPSPTPPTHRPIGNSLANTNSHNAGPSAQAAALPPPFPVPQVARPTSSPGSLMPPGLSLPPQPTSAPPVPPRHRPSHSVGSISYAVPAPVSTTRYSHSHSASVGGGSGGGGAAGSLSTNPYLHPPTIPPGHGRLGGAHTQVPNPASSSSSSSSTSSSALNAPPSPSPAAIVLAPSSPAIEFIRETLYASLADQLERLPRLRAQLKTNPARAYYGAVSFAILDVALNNVAESSSGEGEVVGVRGKRLRRGECPEELRPFFGELVAVGREARAIEREDTEVVVRMVAEGRRKGELPRPRLERVRRMLEFGIGIERDGTRGRRGSGSGDGNSEKRGDRESVEGRAVAFTNKISALALGLTKLRAFRERQEYVFKVLESIGTT